jgi:hypothetical protein
VRRVLDGAARCAVRQMAVFVRTPQLFTGAFSSVPRLTGVEGVFRCAAFAGPINRPGVLALLLLRGQEDYRQAIRRRNTSRSARCRR